MSRARLEELRPENFSAILILADESGSGAIVDADSRSLAVQLLLRDIQACRPRPLRRRHRALLSSSMALRFPTAVIDLQALKPKVWLSLQICKTIGISGLRVAP